VRITLWREWSRGEIDEQFVPGRDCTLTDAEVAALSGLAQTSAEREVVLKVMALIGRSTDVEEQ
jgi:hypothetical protein